MNQRYMYNYMEMMYRHIRLQLRLLHSYKPIGLICLCRFLYDDICRAHQTDSILADVLFYLYEKEALKMGLSGKELNELYRQMKNQYLRILRSEACYICF